MDKEVSFVGFEIFAAQDKRSVNNPLPELVEGNKGVSLFSY